MPSTELIYLLIIAIIGGLLIYWFRGHGGLKVSRKKFGNLPPEGEIVVRQHVVRWRSAEDGSFVAAWALQSGHFVAMKVTFNVDSTDEDADPDQGELELAVDKRVLARKVTWTDQIRDRTLRADAEAILKALSRETKGGQTERKRIKRAKPVPEQRDGDLDG